MDDQKKQRQKDYQKQYQKTYRRAYKERKKRVSVTLDCKEYDQFLALAENDSRKVSQQIKLMALAQLKKQPLPSKASLEKVDEVVIQLRKLGSNINQIARHLNTTSLSEGSSPTGEAIHHLEQIFYMLRTMETFVTTSISDSSQS